MKRATREQLEERERYLSNEQTMMVRALNAVLNHETEFPVSFFAKEVATGETGRYTFRFFDQDSPSGERVTVTYATAGQKNYTVVYDVDQQRAWIQQHPASVWERIFYHALANRKRQADAA